MEIVGWIGTVCLSCCGVPQLLASIKDRRMASGISYSYLCGWIIGILAMLVYIHFRENVSYPYPLQVANLVSLTCACSFMWIRLSYDRIKKTTTQGDRRHDGWVR